MGRRQCTIRKPIWHMTIKNMPTLPEEAEAKDHPPVVEFREWGRANASGYENNGPYFTLMWDQYRVVYSRTSKRIQCYYLGYGHDTVEKPFDEFENLEEIIEFIENSRDMPLFRTEIIRRVYAKVIARDDNYDKKRAEQLRDELAKAIKKYNL